MSEVIQKRQNKKDKKQFHFNIFAPSIITRKIYIPMKFIGSNIKQIMEKMIKDEIEGKCIPEGYIKPNSINILSYSSGELNSESICFDVVCECSVCKPIEGMLMRCNVNHI